MALAGTTRFPAERQPEGADAEDRLVNIACADAARIAVRALTEVFEIRVRGLKLEEEADEAGVQSRGIRANAGGR